EPDTPPMSTRSTGIRAQWTEDRGQRTDAAVSPVAAHRAPMRGFRGPVTLLSAWWQLLPGFALGLAGSRSSLVDDAEPVHVAMCDSGYPGATARARRSEASGQGSFPNSPGARCAAIGDTAASVLRPLTPDSCHPTPDPWSSIS